MTRNSVISSLMFLALACAIGAIGWNRLILLFAAVVLITIVIAITPTGDPDGH